MDIDGLGQAQHRTKNVSRSSQSVSRGQNLTFFRSPMLGVAREMAGLRLTDGMYRSALRAQASVRPPVAASVIPPTMLISSIGQFGQS
jgi:hypothetical protein